MIIFDLDGTLANCDHRRHFVEFPGTWEWIEKEQVYLHHDSGVKREKIIDYKAFYEACDQDDPIQHTLEILINCMLSGRKVEIWSGRCSSVREKTMDWLKRNLYSSHRIRSSLLYDPELKVKMREIGDSTPDDVLKEQWLDEYLNSTSPRQWQEEYKNKHPISMVFDDRPKVVRMWRRRGIFVFDVNQSGKEF